MRTARVYGLGVVVTTRKLGAKVTPAIRMTTAKAIATVIIPAAAARP